MTTWKDETSYRQNERGHIVPKTHPPFPVSPVGEVGEFIQCLQIRAASLGAEGANLSQRGDAAYFTRAATLLEQLSAAAPETPAEALAARPLLEEVARMGDCIGENTVGEIMAISSRADSWLRENPLGQPVAMETLLVDATRVRVDPSRIVRYEFEVFDAEDMQVAGGDADTREDAEREGQQYLRQYSQNGPCTLELRRVEVLTVTAPEIHSQPAAAAAQPPLWRVLQDAYYSVTQHPDVLSEDHERLTIAAEILAVRDRVAPEELEPPAGDGEPWPQAYQLQSDARWEQRQAIRLLLTAEAANALAEAGE